jgi:hypothetical protein
MIDSGSLQNMPAGTTIDIVKGTHAGTWVKINSGDTIELLNLWCNVKTGDLVHYSWLETALRQS